MLGGIFMSQLHDYFSRAMTDLGVILGALITIINFVIFPDRAYANAAFALGIAVLMDIFSKYVAITKRYGGFMTAFRMGKLISKSLWLGTKVKLQAYLVVSIMVGASYRLNNLPGAFTNVSIFIATIVYTVLFLREFQSILENFRDAGVKNVEWLLIWSKDREKEIFKQHNIIVEDTVPEVDIAPEVVVEDDTNGTNYDDLI